MDCRPRAVTSRIRQRLAFRMLAFVMLFLCHDLTIGLAELLEIKLAHDDTGASPRLLRDWMGIAAILPHAAAWIAFSVILLPSLVVLWLHGRRWLQAAELWLLLGLLVAILICCAVASAHAVLGAPYLLVQRTHSLDAWPGFLVALMIWMGLECWMWRQRCRL